MALKDVWNRITHKNDSTELTVSNDKTGAPLASDLFPVVKISDSELSAYKKIPLAGLASLGMAFSKLPEGARSIVQSVTVQTPSNIPLYIGVNPKGVEGYLSGNELGTVGNIMQVNDQGKHVIAGRMRYKQVGDLQLNGTSTTTLPIDPTLMIVAVALMTIEKKLDGIQKSVEEVLQFLKQEKQSRQRGNLNMLSEILEDYKLNCRDEQFCASRANEVLSIKTAAYQDIEFYQGQISAELQKQKGIHGSGKAQSIMDAIAYQFAEYQLACHIFAFSSFLDVLLRRNFESALIDSTTDKINNVSKRYEALYKDCHSQIAKYQLSAIESKIISGIGVATKGLGKVIGSVPIVKDGAVDEALINAGESIEKRNQESVQRKLQSFEVLEVSRTESFIENLQMVDTLYNTENAMITDGTSLYVLQ